MDRNFPVKSVLCGGAVAATSLLVARPASADVFGRLHITVRNADTQKPVSNVSVTLRDSANVRSDIALTLDATGSALTDPLENRAFSITTSAEGFETDTRTINVANDVTTDIVIDLEPVEKRIQITGNRSLLRPRQPTTQTTRDQNFLRRFPATAGNPQQLQGLIATAPGVALDSNNQAHVRGEHTQTSVYIGGFQLGGALVGRFGPLIAPDALQSVDIQTGAFAPEYGSETAAILNTTVRSGPLNRIFDFQPGYGSFGTRQGSFSVGGQFGGPLRWLGQNSPPASNLTSAPGTAPGTVPGTASIPNAATGAGSTTSTGAPGSPSTVAPTGRVEQRFRYFLNGTSRDTDNALEPPQPGNQDAHNDGRARSLLGRFDYVASPRDNFTLTLNTAPATTGVANRTGLSDRYASVGQGYGFGGFVSRSDAQNSGNPLLSVTQQQAGQDINQRDNNDFGILQYRHTFSPQLTGLLSFGGSRNKLDVTNGNPDIYQDISTLGNRPDAAVEFSPTVNRSGKHAQLEGSLTYALAKHSLKFGLSTDQQRGNESYNLIPGSQLALNALYGAAPQLVPNGTPQLDENGEQALDANGNPIYNLAPGAAVPTIGINRRGYYRAAYLQDTWNISRKLTANYGARLDMFKRNETVDGTDSSLKRSQLSPRLNLSYALNPRTLLRTSYNRLFIQPPLSEGGTLGTQIRPETLNQYDVSVERQIAGNQSLKLGYYYKQIRDQLDIALLVPGSQIGIYSAVNLGRAGVHGLEASYQLAPRRGYGFGGYASLARSVAKFVDAEEGSDFNDHDQRYTLSAGSYYQTRSGALAGLDVYYGSGTASSAIAGDGAFGFSGKRQDRTRVNLRVQTSPKLFGGKGGLRVDVDNLFNDRALINFGSDFSGTRFQQGRRIVLSAYSSF